MLQDSLVKSCVCGQHVRTSAGLVLRKYSNSVRFACNEHLDWGMNFSTKIIVNIFYNNKQKEKNNTVRKSEVSGLKTRQRPPKQEK